MLSADELRSVGFERLETEDVHGRRIGFYLSTGEGARQLPLVMFVQGSGYHPLFWHQDGILASQRQTLLAQVGVGRVRVLCVEKPGLESDDRVPQSGTAMEAPVAFLLEHTIERWTAALSAALEAALEQHETRSPILACGHSEGAVVCARLARLRPAITHVGVLGGSGPSQLFDLLYRAHKGDEAVMSVLAEYDRLSNDDSEELAFVWGHPVRRWRSFLSVSTIHDLLQANVETFCAHGTADESVPFPSALALVAELLSQGRAIHFLPVTGGDHGFRTAALEGNDGFRQVFSALVDWYTRPQGRRSS